METSLQTESNSEYMYQRHEPEKTVLYQVISQNLKTFLSDCDVDPAGSGIPKYVRNEFDAYLKCGILQYGFLRLQCEGCKEERLVAFSCKKRGFCPSCGGRRMAESALTLSEEILPKVAIRQWVLSLPMPLRYFLAANPSLVTSVLEILMRAIKGFYEKRARGKGIANPKTGAVTFVQRFGSALNLNIHFHILFLNGVYNDEMKPGFHWLSAPCDKEVKDLIRRIAERILRHLRRRGYLLEKEIFSHEKDKLSEENPLLASFIAASIQNKVALVERAGQRVRKLGIHPMEAEVTGSSSAAIQGFSLHAGVSVMAHEREKLEKLIRYVARPALALGRLEWAKDGQLIYRLKKTFSDGTTHVLFTAMELLEKLTALIPQPKIHLVRYHGVLAPHSRLRSKIVPEKSLQNGENQPKKFSSKNITWAKLLKKTFKIDLSVCATCGGNMRFISEIMERVVVRKILQHLKLPMDPPRISPARAPPQLGFDF